METEPSRESPSLFAPDKALSWLGGLCALAAGAALLDLALRAALRLEVRNWDMFLYHVPFAARRGGLSIPFQMNDAPEVQGFYEGFPPLPHLVQGLLWRLTGSLNATGVVNYLAFASFLAFCHAKLKARSWLVALIALTAPLVLIHTAVGCVDLFGNVFLAIGISSFVRMRLFDERRDRVLLVCGLLGLAATAWSKFQLTPLAAVFFAAFGILLRAQDREERRSALLLTLAAAVLAAAPYVKNLRVYGNPFWPVRIPVVGDRFPYAIDLREAHRDQRPPALASLSQARLFLQSLFEIGYPTSNVPRWTVDQGQGGLAFRMGGFWNISVAVFLSAAAGLALLFDRRKGLGFIAGGLALLIFTAFLPQSHELRYYLFLPLCWAAVIAMLFEPVSRARPKTASACLLVFLGLFLYMAALNRDYYRIERIGYREAAGHWGADAWWGRLKPGMSYCVVDMAPIAILMTGPTMSEYRIVERSDKSLCPEGMPVIYNPLEEALRRAQRGPSAENFLELCRAYYAQGRFEDGISAAREALKLKPGSAQAFNGLGSGLAALKRWDQAVEAFRNALRLDPRFELARSNLAWAKSQSKTSPRR